MRSINRQNVLFDIENGAGIITLNRPNNLNALDLQMIHDIYNTLHEWRNNEDILFIVLTSSSSRSFSAGGDIRVIYERKNERDVGLFCKEIFGTQYKISELIHQYPKPVIVNMNGVIMGGGVGMASGATFRIVTENTKWAMPELNIGFFPDSGATYTFTKMPNNIGTYLALTSTILQAPDVLYIHAADYYMLAEKWPQLLHDLKTYSWNEAQIEDEINQLIKRYATSPNEPAPLQNIEEKIAEHFAYNKIEHILDSLEEAGNKGDEWATNTRQTMLKKSPTSLKVVLEQLRIGSHLSLEECIRMEINMAVRFIEKGDFFEGVRAIIIDKDQKPKWNPSHLSSVTDEHVRYFFQ